MLWTRCSTAGRSQRPRDLGCPHSETQHSQHSTQNDGPFGRADLSLLGPFDSTCTRERTGNTHLANEPTHKQTNTHIHVYMDIHNNKTKNKRHSYLGTINKKVVITTNTELLSN